MWKMFRAVMNWHAHQKDEQPRKWYRNLPVIPEDEQSWFTQDEIKRLVASAKGQTGSCFIQLVSVSFAPESFSGFASKISIRSVA
jgi:hypothetical protein